jgi:uncharacterized repeat protein (TIGR01451 family)
MKNRKYMLTLIVSLWISMATQAQFVNITDNKFVNFLTFNFPSAMNGAWLDTTNSVIINTTSVYSAADSISNLDGIQYFDNLMSLTIKDNIVCNIVAFPPNLVYLDLSNNRLLNIPPLPIGLTYLNLSVNGLQAISSLPTPLLNFNCSFNLLTSLPVLPTGLTTLACSNNQISILPLLPLTLTQLNCGFNTLGALPVLPATLTTLTCCTNLIALLPTIPLSVQFLDCSANLLSSLPVLPLGLTHLNCGNNTLGSFLHTYNIPSTVLHFDCSITGLFQLPILPAGLQLLNCSANHIATLPVLPVWLQTLNCGSNQFTVLPSLPNTLIHLYCGNNFFVTLPTLSPILQTLFCNDNQLSILPSLPNSLKYLNCSNNPLFTLPSLPPNLLTLSCKSNQLSVLPLLPTTLIELNFSFNTISALSPLPANLMALHCVANQLTVLNPLPQNLGKLHCDNNQLTCLPLLPASLYSLSFTMNQINCIPNIPNALLDTTDSYPALRSLPICGLFNSSSCPAFNNISGIVYLDVDTTCTYNTIDNTLQNVAVQLWQNNVMIQQFFTTPFGEYTFKVSSFDTFYIKIDTSNLPFYISCFGQAGLMSVITASDTVDANMNFAMLCKSTLKDVKALPILAGLHRPGRYLPITIHITDLVDYGYTCAISTVGGQIKLFKTGPFKFLIAGNYSLQPTTLTRDSLIWTVPHFNAPYNKITFIGLVDSTATIGQSVNYFLQGIPSQPDILPVNDTLTTAYAIRNGYDPNIKTVNPEGNIQSKDSILTYTIHFQNTGNDTAFNIIVKDTLDAYLDPKSISIIDASYNPFVQVFGGVIVFNFININIVDSLTNEARSHGHVSFTIKRKSATPYGYSIKNTAHIYFDLNPAIVTNTTISTLTNKKNLTFVNEQTTSKSLLIFPNPTTSILKVQINSCIKNGTIKIFTLEGKLAYEQSNLYGSAFMVDMEKYTNGVYFIELLSNNNAYRAKFLKQ